MTLLLDTHALVWWHTNDRRLGARARAVMMSPPARPYVSVASIWEAAIKYAVGRLRLPKPPHELLSDVAMRKQGFQILSIGVEHALAAAALPPHHPDPFDRMLIAQAKLEDFTLVTADLVFDKYDIRLLDARS